VVANHSFAHASKVVQPTWGSVYSPRVMSAVMASHSVRLASCREVTNSLSPLCTSYDASHLPLESFLTAIETPSARGRRLASAFLCYHHDLTLISLAFNRFSGAARREVLVQNRYLLVRDSHIAIR
jgi:hypothetical protein